jgi:hypothetical protein
MLSADAIERGLPGTGVHAGLDANNIGEPDFREDTVPG